MIRLLAILLLLPIICNAQKGVHGLGTLPIDTGVVARHFRVDSTFKVKSLSSADTQLIATTSNGTFIKYSRSNIQVTIDTSRPNGKYASKYYVDSLNGVYVPYTGATQNVDLGSRNLKTDRVNTDTLEPNTSAGIHLHNTSHQDIFIAGAGGGQNLTIYAPTNFDLLKNQSTTDTVLTTNSSGTIQKVGIASTYLKQGDTASMLTNYVRNNRSISTTYPLSGGGDLSANRTFALDTANWHSAAYYNTIFAPQGSVTSSGLTMSTSMLLGRTTASTGAIEQITVSSPLSLSGGALSSTAATGSVAGHVTTTSQSFGGVKTFVDKPIFSAGTSTSNGQYQYLGGGTGFGIRGSSADGECRYEMADGGYYMVWVINRSGTRTNHMQFDWASSTGAKFSLINNTTLNIGTTTSDASAAFQVSSTTKGILPPKMTTTQRTAITATEGLMVYDKDLHKLYVYDGTTWQACW